MAEKKLVKIKNLYLYIGNTKSISDCNAAVELLQSKGIKFNLLNYSDQVDHHKANFQAVSGWALGQDGHKKVVTDFPFLVWDECFDDWSTFRRVAHGLAEIKQSDPVKYLTLL